MALFVFYPTDTQGKNSLRQKKHSIDTNTLAGNVFVMMSKLIFVQNNNFSKVCTILSFF